jgi:translation initiation factor IF-3
LALNKPFNRGPRLPFKKKEAEHNINQFIRAQEVRLVGDNVEQGIFSLRDALAIAQEQELDLVEISPNANPPFVK